jgi:hypothetical protein
VACSEFAHCVTGWVAKLQKRGLSESRVRQSYHLFTNMLEAAVHDKRIATNRPRE